MRYWVLTAAAWVCTTALAAQDADIRVHVQRVNLLVTISDGKGRFVTDIEQDRFTVFEDGVPQAITNFDRPTDLPLQLALLLDTSASVRTQFEFEREAARRFILSLMLPQDRALLAHFDRGLTLEQDFTNRPQVIAQAIDRLQAGGGTSLFDALHTLAVEKMSSGTNRKILVLVSDGIDVHSRHSKKDALRMVQSSETTIYAIGTNRFGADQKRKGWSLLEELAEKTGGRALFPYSAANLEESFEEINKELRNQYLIVYNPSNQGTEAGFRKIKIKIKNKPRGLKIRHREGYYYGESP